MGLENVKSKGNLKISGDIEWGVVLNNSLCDMWRNVQRINDCKKQQRMVDQMSYVIATELDREDDDYDVVKGFVNLQLKKATTRI